MRGRKATKLFVLLGLLCLATGVVLAQGTPILRRWLIGGGGTQNGPAINGSTSLQGALGEPIAGRSSNGNVSLVSGFWSKTAATPEPTPTPGPLYLPVILQDYGWAAKCAPENNYCEGENDLDPTFDEWKTAYGRLKPSTAYCAYPNDLSDYYYFDTYTTEKTNIKLTNYRATGQLLLYRHRDGQDPEFVDRRWNGPTMEMQLDLRAARYYVRVYTTSNTNSDHLYCLTITHP